MCGNLLILHLSGMKLYFLSLTVLIIAVAISCNTGERQSGNYVTYNINEEQPPETPQAGKERNDFFYKLSESAISLTHQKVIYDPAYFSIAYPNGDVPADRGVCCDVIIRAYRKLGIDLQKDVHEDMQKNLSAYPKNWKIRSLDKNIDHRRVPNLMKFFERRNASLRITSNSEDYKCGDIVCWNLGRGQTHIGIVIDKRSGDNKRNLVVHNIGNGQVISDCLFKFPIIGHYRYRK